MTEPEKNHLPDENAEFDASLAAPPPSEAVQPQPVVVAVEPVVVPRWVQAIGLAAALWAIASLAQSAGGVLVVFLVAALVALIINPMVSLLQRIGIPRGLAIGAVFIAFLGLLAGAALLLARPVARQVMAFQADLPALIDSANESLADLQGWLDGRGIGLQVKRPGETALQTLQANVLQGSGDLVAFTGDLLTLMVEASFVLVLTVVIAIYMLLYGPQIGALVRGWMPTGDGTAEDDYPARVQRAVFGYVRGQLLFSFIMGLSAGVALWLFGALGIFPAGKTYAVFFGVFYGLMELIPYLGPVLGATPPVLVALLQGDWQTALWLVLLFVALQQLEGHVVAPQVFGHSLRINPLVVIFALMLGGQLHGIPGALLALPLAAIVRETVLYLRAHLVLEPWGTPSAAILRSPPRPPPVSDAGGTHGWQLSLGSGFRRKVRAIAVRRGRGTH